MKVLLRYYELAMNDKNHPIEDKSGLTRRQKEAFDMMRSAKNICLMSGQLDGENTAIICATFDDEENPEQVLMVPLYVEVTPSILARLQDSDGVLPVDYEADLPPERLKERFAPSTPPIRKRQKPDS